MRKESDDGLCVGKVNITKDEVFKFYKQELYTDKALLNKARSRLLVCMQKVSSGSPDCKKGTLT